MYKQMIAMALSLAVASGAEASAGADRISAFLDQVNSLRAEFSQTLYDEERNRLEDASGTMYLERPGRFRWDYEQPYPQSIVSNGKTLWMYDSELEQVTVKSLDSAIENTPSMVLASEQPLDDHFVVAELPQEDGKVWVELRPRSSEATFALIRLRFGGDEMDMMELVDNFGQTTHLEFSGLRKNAALESGLFEFSPPAGADVISD